MPCFPLICRDALSLRWWAITCMGAQIARLAEENMEEARIMMRRFLWSLNDESGGIGWGAPESMAAEVMCNHAALAEEYVHMLISYMREDGDELHQDGNYIEHPLLQRGLLWAVARLAECKPELLLTRGADKDVLPYLDSSDAEVRGLAALACGRLGIAEAKDGLYRLCQETTTFPLYHAGTLTQVRLNELAQKALKTLGLNMDDALFPAASCLQFSIELGEIATNLQRVQAVLAAQPPVPGTLVVLPEIWATGFDYPQTERLGQRTPEILAWMQEQSQKGGFFLAGSLTNLPPDAPHPFNTLFLVGPEGVLGSVSKQQLSFVSGRRISITLPGGQPLFCTRPTASLEDWSVMTFASPK